MHIEAALDSYVMQLRADGRSEHTIKQYQRHIRLLARWLAEEGRDLKVETLDHEVLALFMVSDTARLRPDGQPKRAAAMNALRSSLRTYFSYLHAAGITSTNPARLIRRARCGTPPPRALSQQETDRLLAALDQAESPLEKRDAVLFKLMLLTGIRVGSAVGLDVEDVDLDAGELMLRTVKNNRPDRVFLPPDTVALLQPFIQDRTGPLFTDRTGRRISSRQVQRRLHVWAERAAIRLPTSPHGLRHTFGMRIYERTGDLLVTQAALRHASVASTMVYARCDDRRLRQALAG